MGLFDGLWEVLGGFLEGIANDPQIYAPIFFLYSIAAAIFLPIPVELGLFMSPATPFFVLAFVLASGKAVGSILVFYIGCNVEGPILRLREKWNWYRRFVDACQRFVEKFSYVGLYVILSIPFMVDTIPIYIFSIFNKDNKMNVRYFATVNFFAGLTRAAIIYAVLELFGVMLI